MRRDVLRDDRRAEMRDDRGDLLAHRGLPALLAQQVEASRPLRELAEKGEARLRVDGVVWAGVLAARQAADADADPFLSAVFVLPRGRGVRRQQGERSAGVAGAA